METKETIKNILKTTGKILLIIFLIIGAFFILKTVAKSIFPDIKLYVVKSGSMEPELKVGDIVIAKKVEPQELKVGDIISYKEGQNIITHRIVKILTAEDELQFETKGDNNASKDLEKVKESEIEGKVTQKISSLGKIILLFDKN